MSQNAKNDTCSTCKKALITNHTFQGVSPEGKVRVQCHPEPLATTDLVLKYVLEAIAAKLAAQSELVEVKKKHAGEIQAKVAQTERDFEAKVASRAAEKTAAEIIEIEADYKREIEEGEETRVNLVAAHDAKVLDLEQLLKEVCGDNKTIREEKTALVESLAACEDKCLKQQLKIVELADAHSELKARYNGLKDSSLVLVRSLVSMSTRVAVLEEKTGVIPKVDPKAIYAMITGQEYDDETIPVDDLINDPPPALPPAPKADVAPVPTAAAQAAPAPAQPTNVVELDDSEPESESSFASLNDERGDYGECIVDDDVVAQDAASDEDDEESSEEDEAEKCSVCDQSTAEEMSFVKKDGSEGRLTACDPRKHADAFLAYLKQAAKKAPKSAVDVISLFNPIQQ